MNIIGTVAIINTIPNKFSKDGQKVIFCNGFKITGTALELARFNLNIPDGATSDVTCEDFITLDQARNILNAGGRISGLILDNGMQLSRNTHLYDYPLFVSKIAKTISMEEYYNLMMNCNNNLKSVGYYTAFRASDELVSLYSLPVEDRQSYKLTLKKQIIEKDKSSGEEVVTGYEVSMGTGATVLMEIDAIAKNAEVIEPNNFIVKKTGGRYSFSAKPGESLKDLPVINFGVKSQVGKVSKTEKTTTKDASLTNICKKMREFDVEWLKLSKKGEYKETVGEQEYDLLGIDIAYPDVRYSVTSLNANLTFKKLATTRIDYDDGHMFEVVNCFTYATRSLYDTKGTKGLENVYMLCSESKKANFIFELKEKFGIELVEMKKSKAQTSLAYINSGILKYDDYVILEGDFSHVKTVTDSDLAWAKSFNVRLMQESVQVLKGERTYLKKHRDTLKQAIDAMKDVTGVEVPEKPVCKAYMAFDDELKEAMKVAGIDLSNGSFVVTPASYGAYTSPIVYSIPKVPAITSKDFSKTLAEAKNKILSDKNPLKKKVYAPMFQYLENYVNAVNNCPSDIKKLEFAENCLKQIDEKLDEFTRAFWFYNQWCVSGIDDGDIYVYDNGASEIVGTIGNKVECTILNGSDVHNKYLVTIDLTKLKFADGDQRNQMLSNGKFTAPCPYAMTASIYNADKEQ